MFKTSCKTRLTLLLKQIIRPHLMFSLTLNRAWSGNEWRPEGSQHRNLSHSLVRNIKRGSSQQARNVKWIETRLEATECNTEEPGLRGIWMRRVASSAGNTPSVCCSQHLSHWNHYHLHISKERKWAFDPVYDAWKLCQIKWHCCLSTCVYVRARHHSSSTSVFSVICGAVQFQYST